jgi:hypothetical protein
MKKININVQTQKDLFDLLVKLGGKVVNTGHLSTLEIQQAWASKRIWVDSEEHGLGLGYVWVPVFKDTFPGTVEEVELFKACYPLELLKDDGSKIQKFIDKQSQIIQQAYDEKMAEKKNENNNIIVNDISTATIPEEDILKRPTNYSLHQIFERLKSGRKRQDQLLLQDLIEIVDKNEPFVIISTQEYDNYNALVTLLIEKHLGTFKEANVNGFFKKEQLLNRGYSSTATLGQI